MTKDEAVDMVHGSHVGGFDVWDTVEAIYQEGMRRGLERAAAMIDAERDRIRGTGWWANEKLMRENFAARASQIRNLPPEPWEERK